MRDVFVTRIVYGLGLGNYASKLGAIVLFCKAEREHVIENAQKKVKVLHGEMGAATERTLAVRSIH